jgi:CRP/FNR family transcriptional regulator
MDERSFSEIVDRLVPGHSHLFEALSAMPEELRRTISGTARLRDVPRGEVLVSEGQEGTEIGYVLDGALGMVKALPDGRVHILGILVPTDLYGRLFDGPSDYSIEALAETRLLCFDRAAFEAVLRKAPELERLFMVSVLDELDAAREWILLLNGTQVVERVAAFLVILARRSGEIRGVGAEQQLVVRLPIARGDFARCLGVRKESLSRALHRLDREGAIRIAAGDNFEIADIGALVEASGQDLVLPARLARRRFG